jgi:hypothetical protein
MVSAPRFQRRIAPCRSAKITASGISYRKAGRGANCVGSPRMRGICQRRTFDSVPTEGSMPGAFRIGDHVSWNSEAGRVSGVIRRKISAPIKFKGYTVRATREEPQYMIKSDRTDHVAVHKGSALRKLRRPAPARAASKKRRRRRF